MSMEVLEDEKDRCMRIWELENVINIRGRTCVPLITCRKSSSWSMEHGAQSGDFHEHGTVSDNDEQSRCVVWRMSVDLLVSLLWSSLLASCQGTEKSASGGAPTGYTSIGNGEFRICVSVCV